MCKRALCLCCVQRTRTMNTNKAGSDATLIFGISRHRLTTDGEGVTTLVAFSGCPLRCKYCLNKASWEPDKGLATKGGITFGGGEPLLQVEFIKEFRELCGSQWHLLAETSLNVPFENVKTLDAVLDGYIVDIKDLNPEIYKTYTGKDNALVLSNLQWLLQHGDPNRIMVRVPHIPDFNTDEDVERSKKHLETMGVTSIDEFQYIIR